MNTLPNISLYLSRHLRGPTIIISDVGRRFTPTHREAGKVTLLFFGELPEEASSLALVLHLFSLNKYSIELLFTQLRACFGLTSAKHPLRRILIFCTHSATPGRGGSLATMVCSGRCWWLHYPSRWCSMRLMAVTNGYWVDSFKWGLRLECNTNSIKILFALLKIFRFWQARRFSP